MNQNFPTSVFVVLALSAGLFVTGFLLMMMSSDPIAAALPAGVMVLIALGSIVWCFVRNRSTLREYFSQAFTSGARQ